MWNKPPHHIYNLHTGGSALENPGRIDSGGILRDSNGDMIYAYATPLRIGTNNQDKIQATVFGVHWCIQHGYMRIILEAN